MKKIIRGIISIILIMLVVISIIIQPVQAVSYTVNFTPEIDNTVETGRKIVLEINIPQFADIKNGEYSFSAILEYDNYRFEKLTAMNLESYGEWKVPTINKDTNKINTKCICSGKNNEKVLIMELRAKRYAALGDTIVKLKDIKIIDENQEISLDDQQIVVNIREQTRVISDDPVIEIDPDDRIIERISSKTTVNDFKSKFTKYAMKVYNLEGQEINNEQYIGTGMKTEILSNTYILIVTGDLNGDGKITVTDLSKMKEQMVGINRLSKFYKFGADINNDNVITVTDLSRLKQALIGLIKL